MFLSVATLWPLSYLTIAVLDDLVYKKFHNFLFIALTLLSVVYVATFAVVSPMDAVGGFICGGLLMLPLVLMGATGSGDLKFMMCFGALMGTLDTFNIFLMALFWGALIGVLQSLFAGRLKELSQNMIGFAYRLRPVTTQKIPYTVAILLAWMTHRQFGGFL